MLKLRLSFSIGLLVILSTSSVYAQPPSGAMSFISRLDTNGNGRLDPDEQGRARPFLERIARETGGLDLNRPIPLSLLSSKVQQMQGGSSDRSRSRDRNSQPRVSGDRRYDEEAAAAEQGLVPGFNDGAEDEVPPVGFGSKAEYLNVDVIQSDFDEADKTIKRYDRNRNGVLDQDEIRSARWTYGNPMNQDRNGDGKLTRSELAVRYSIRRDTQKDLAREKAFRDSQNPQSSQQPQGGQPPSRGMSRFGGGSFSSADRMGQFADSMFQRYDSNKSGVLEKDEWKNFRTDPTPWDTNKDGKITRDELIKGMSTRFSGGRSQPMSTNSPSRNGSPTPNISNGQAPASGSSGASPRSFRFKTAHERLPEGIPQWYRDGDRNKDGQIAMSEYAGQWDEKTLAEYYVYDKNRDGTVTVEEVLAAAQTGFVRGVTPPPMTVTPSAGSTSYAKPGPAETVGGVDPKHMKYAMFIIGKYDANKDGVLDLDEGSKSSMIKPEFDSDSDGKLTPQELAIGFGKK